MITLRIMKDYCHGCSNFYPSVKKSTLIIEDGKTVLNREVGCVFEEDAPKCFKNRFGIDVKVNENSRSKQAV